MQFYPSSYATIYGTVNEYGPSGNLIGPLDITAYGIFFKVRDKWGYDTTNPTWIQKSVGTGITKTAPTTGNFIVTFSQTETKLEPKEYVYGCWVSPTGTIYVEGTTQMKCIGTGIFDIIDGMNYGSY
jgi:hypothetical protein